VFTCLRVFLMFFCTVTLTELSMFCVRLSHFIIKFWVWVLNAAARLTSDSCRYEHVMPLLNDLHWLRVPECITYKLCVLVYNCLHGTAPQYLQEIIQPVAEVTSRCRLRSASSSALVVPATRRSSLGDRAFAVAGPRAWNSLPEFVTDCSSLLTFKKYPKT